MVDELLKLPACAEFQVQFGQGCKTTPSRPGEPGGSRQGKTLLGADRLGGDPIFHHRDDRGQNCAGNAAAGELPDEGADVDRAAGLGKRRNQGRQNLPADTAADGAGNRIS
jgi:hypothetical protein